MVLNIKVTFTKLKSKESYVMCQPNLSLNIVEVIVVTCHVPNVSLRVYTLIIACFPEIHNLQLRSDFSFRAKIQESHHIVTSVLESLPGIDMIETFPLVYMHLVCLGVVKKLIVNLWLNGKPKTKLSFNQSSEISKILEQIPFIPKEFNRKPQSLND